MGLPDVERLLTLPRETWRALGLRLAAIGLDHATVSPFWDKARSNPLHSPTVKWHLRRLSEASAYAMRMLMFWDAVTEDEARSALGDEVPLELLIEVGFLRRTDAGGVVSPFEMKTADAGRLYVFCDDVQLGGDAVMGPSEATLALASFARPRVREARALDLGCGPGTVALTMAPMCDHVVGTDISPRAIALAKLNAWVNGVDNVEFRTGDLFEPAGEEVFDVVASQPPFIPRPPDMPATVFLFGGDRGDELPRRMLQEVALHLAPGGLAAFMIVWPIVEGDPPLEHRLREALGGSPDLSLLVMQTVPPEQSSINATCSAYAAIRNGSNRDGYERDVLRFREHFEGQKIRNLVDTYVFVRRAKRAAGEDVGWTAIVPTSDLGATPATRASVDLLLAAGDRAFRRAPVQSSAREPRLVSIDLRTTVPIRSALSMAEYLAATGRSDQAVTLYGDVQKSHPAWRPALLGAARLEIAAGRCDGWSSRLAPIADQGDREARRLLGDIHWRRGEVDAALGYYAVDPRAQVRGPAARTDSSVENKVDLTRRTAQEKPFLVWITCRSFESSLAGAGLQLDKPRRWDLAVNRFAASNEPVDKRVEYVIEGGLSKLASVKAAVRAHPGIFDGYQGVLLLDDDIGIAHEDVDRFFWLMSRYQLDVAHPSFSDASSGQCPPMFHQRESMMRFTNTVDVRAPAFSRSGLTTCLDSFDQSISGDGLGHVWAHLLRPRGRVIGVIDSVIVTHLRPIDPVGGSFYTHLRELGIDPIQEMHDVHLKYGCWFLYPRTVGDVSPSGLERHYLE